MRLIRDGEKGGEGDYIPIVIHCHHQNDSYIKMGSDESRCNFSVGSDGQSHKTVSSNYNLSEEKGEPKRYRTEVLPLTSLTPYRWAKAAHKSQTVLPLLAFVRVFLRHAAPFFRHLAGLMTTQAG